MHYKSQRTKSFDFRQRFAIDSVSTDWLLKLYSVKSDRHEICVIGNDSFRLLFVG